MPTNEQRAEWAAHALDAYGIKKEGAADYDAPEDMAADLICDLLHLIRAHGFDCPVKKLATAKTNFEAEELEEQDGVTDILDPDEYKAAKKAGKL